MVNTLVLLEQRQPEGMGKDLMSGFVTVQVLTILTPYLALHLVHVHGMTSLGATCSRSLGG